MLAFIMETEIILSSQVHLIPCMAEEILYLVKVFSQETVEASATRGIS